MNIATGTDVGMPWITPGVSFHRELELLVESGIPLTDVYSLATENGAFALRQNSNFGRIAPGLYADILILTNDPIKDIRNSRSIELVFKEGKIYDPKDLMDSIGK